jgi:hypothetical protein
MTDEAGWYSKKRFFEGSEKDGNAAWLFLLGVPVDCNIFTYSGNPCFVSALLERRAGLIDYS